MKPWSPPIRGILIASATWDLVASGTWDLCCVSWSSPLRGTFIAFSWSPPLRGTFVASAGCLRYVGPWLHQLAASVDHIGYVGPSAPLLCGIFLFSPGLFVASVGFLCSVFHRFLYEDLCTSLRGTHTFATSLCHDAGKGEEQRCNGADERSVYWLRRNTKKERNRCGRAVDLIHTEYENRLCVVAAPPQPRKPSDAMNQENDKDPPAK